MCGIAAYFGPPFKADFVPSFRHCLDQLVHRGPDDSGVWYDEAAGIILGHRRLSILDLSPTGHQPMFSRNGRWGIVFNGEIYNWKELRDELVSLEVSFKGTSDTEVLLEGIACWGVKTTLEKCVGMFAFAVWDRPNRRLYIARDRIGEKPLYFGYLNRAWWIASELKAIASHPDFADEIDFDAVQLFLQVKHIPHPYSIYKHVSKLAPGTLAMLRSDGSFEQIPYWVFEDAIRQGQERVFQGTEMDAVDQLDALVRRSIALQRVADVPVGAFLSGGIDSSTIVALMQAQGQEPVKTFTIGFSELDYDESSHAERIARRLQTDHTSLIVTPDEAMSVIPSLTRVYDEPFADSSAIPTILVSRLARSKVTVSLSGDAGDELFGGYPRYRAFSRLCSNLSNVEPWLKQTMSWASSFGGTLSHWIGHEEWRYRFEIRKRLARYATFQDLYHGLMAEHCLLDDLLLQRNDREPDPVEIPVSSPYLYGMAHDTLQYLPGDILTKIDRAAMSCSLETRIPLLDHRIVEWAWTLPEPLRIDAHQPKKLLRALLSRYIPRELFERPKSGFSIPLGQWIRGPLREWAESLLSKESLQTTGIFDVHKTHRLWAYHREGLTDRSHQLWALLILQAWFLEKSSLIHAE